MTYSLCNVQLMTLPSATSTCAIYKHHLARFLFNTSEIISFDRMASKLAIVLIFMLAFCLFLHVDAIIIGILKVTVRGYQLI